MNTKQGILFIGIAFLIFCAFVGTVSAAISVPDDYMKIQWAVNNATEGDTIIARDGIYTENVDVDVNTPFENYKIDAGPITWQLTWVYETDDSPSCVSVSSDGTYIAIGSTGGLYFLDRDKNLLWSYPTNLPITDVSMTVDAGQIVAGGSNGGYIIPDGIVYSLNRQGEFVWSIESTGVSSVALSSDGDYFAMTYVHGLGWNDVIALWGDSEGQWLWYHTFGRPETGAVSVSTDGAYIAVGGAADPWGNDGGLRLYSKAGNLLWEYGIDTTTLGGDKYSVSISSDGKYVAAGNRGNNNLYFFDRDQGFLWNYNTGPVEGVSVSADGNHIVAASSDKIYLFDRYKNLLWTYEINNIEDVSMSADAAMIVAVTEDNKVYAFGPSPENQLPTSPTNLAQFKSDSETIISVGGTTDERTVIFKSDVSDPDGDKVKLQVELRRLDEYGGQFDETKGGLKNSVLVESGSEAVACANGLIDADYHWRARAVDEHEETSEWVEFGKNDISDVDFTVAGITYSYDPQAAVNYAETWWNGRNSTDSDACDPYKDYGDYDCANFVSQCLIAGGLDLSGHPGANSYTCECIINCTNLHDFLVNYLGVTWDMRYEGQEEPEWFKLGDPAIFGKGEEHPRTHAVIAVTGDATHNATCNAHSDSTNHSTISDFYDANPSFDRCTFYHIPREPTEPAAKPVLTSPLKITPEKETYYVGDALTAEFTITNIGDVPITLDKLLLGGRFNDGELPNGEYPDFTFNSTTLQPNVPYKYTGTLTLTQPGNYQFFIAYYIENPTPEEKALLDKNNWNTCVDLGEGLTDEDRTEDMVVGVPPTPTEFWVEVDNPAGVGAYVCNDSVDFTFERNLKREDSGDDVKYLQVVLNANPVTQVAVEGPGSPYHETDYFGELTKAAVIKFQTLRGLTQSGEVDSATRVELNKLPLPVKHVPNGWVLNVTNTHQDEEIYDGYIWWEVEDVTDGIAGWSAYQNISDGTKYLKKGDQEELRSKTRKLNTKDERISVILEAVNHYYNNEGTTPSLYSSKDEGNDFSLFKGNNFPIELILAMIAQESGGAGYNNERNDAEKMYNDDGIMQIDYDPSKGNGCGIKCYSNNCKYYTNTTQGVYANIKDGLRVLQDFYTYSNHDNIGAVWRYNGGNNPYDTYCDGRGDPSYLKNVADELNQTVPEDFDYSKSIVVQELRSAQEKVCCTIYCFYNKTSSICEEKCNECSFKGIFKGGRADTLPPETCPKLRLLVTKLKSPGELRVYDSQGRVTGLVNGEIKNEIPGAEYSDDTVTIFFPSDAYTYEVVGTATGIYGLTIISIEDGNATTFTATDIPTAPGAVHQYTIDWDALSQGEEGVTVEVDSDGDGIFEHTFTSDGELTSDDFMLQTVTTIDFDPDTLNLQSKGKWVTTYIELPEGCDVSAINVSTVMLNETVPAELHPTGIGDYDSDGIADLMVKFDRQAVIDMLPVGDAVNVTVTGELYDRTPFEGSGTIRVIDEG